MLKTKTNYESQFAFHSNINKPVYSTTLTTQSAQLWRAGIFMTAVMNSTTPNILETHNLILETPEKGNYVPQYN